MKNSAPRHLKAEARSMWERLLADYQLEDAAAQALLRAACEAFQRAQEARRILDRDGAIVKDRFGQLKAHPAAAVERDSRTAMIAALRALRLEGGE